MPVLITRVSANGLVRSTCPSRTARRRIRLGRQPRTIQKVPQPRSESRVRELLTGTRRARRSDDVAMNRSLFTLIAGLAVIAMPVAHAPTSAQIAAAEEQATAARPPRNPGSPTQPQSMSYTHYVRPDGSPTSSCSATEPCSLTRAVSLIGSANMRPGSIVLLQRGADGVYSQAALTFAGSGTAEEPIRFIGENGVRLTGTRARAPAAQWTRVPERRVHLPDRVGRRGDFRGWQRGPASPRHDVAPDSGGRPPAPCTRSRWAGPSRSIFRFGIPRERRSPRSRRSTARSGPIDRTMSCMCTCATTVPRRRPTTCFSGSSGWGSVVINGDYLSLENIAIEQVSGTALKVNPSASGTVLRNVAARAAQVWLEGVNTVAEDLDVSHVIFQGPIGGTCYDAESRLRPWRVLERGRRRRSAPRGTGGAGQREGPGGAAGARASVVERRTDRRAADPDRVAVLGLSQPHAGGQRHRVVSSATAPS